MEGSLATYMLAAFLVSLLSPTFIPGGIIAGYLWPNRRRWAVVVASVILILDTLLLARSVPDILFRLSVSSLIPRGCALVMWIALAAILSKSFPNLRIEPPPSPPARDQSVGPITSRQATMRWFKAVIASAITLAVTFLVSVGVFAPFFESANVEVTYSSAAGWAVGMILSSWVGLTLAPPQHRHIALAIFSFPAIFVGLDYIEKIALGAHKPAVISVAIGSWTACVGIVLIAWRFWSSRPYGSH